MNGKKARQLRKIMDVKKPSAATGGYVWFDVINWAWMYSPRKNSMMNIYRGIKRRYIRSR